MILKKALLAAFAFFLCLALTACSDEDSGDNPPQATDYSQPQHWLSLPQPTAEVDVFYLYPTVWAKENASDPNINEIDNPSMLAGAPIAFSRQASAFNTVGNLYAPYYRQADAQYVLTLPTEAQRAEVMAGIPTLDVVAAFDHYINYVNDGRPFILAAHSQGSNVLLNLLADYMSDHPTVYERMVAAYVIGYSVTQSYLDDNNHLSFATSADDTQVIISYNTQAAEVDEGDNPLVLADAVAINPINWRRDETLATTDEGLGSYLPVDGEFTTVAQYADAAVDTAKGVIITTADTTGLNMDFGPGIFHRYDYAFYYYNLRANAAQRVAAFLAD